MCVFFIAFLFAAAHEPNIIASSSGSMNIQLCKNNPSVVICAPYLYNFRYFHFMLNLPNVCTFIHPNIQLIHLTSTSSLYPYIILVNILLALPFLFHVLPYQYAPGRF